MDNDIYHDQIIEWSKRKEHMGTLEKADCHATENNRLCGDRISVEVKLYRNWIEDIAFHVRGCILAKASAAHLAFLAIGLNIKMLGKLGQDFKKALKEKEPEFSFPESHDFFKPVRSRKSRHSCVLLPYDTVMLALCSMSGDQIHHGPTFSTGPIPSSSSFHDAHVNVLTLPDSSPGAMPSGPKQPSRADASQVWTLQG